MDERRKKPIWPWIVAMVVAVPVLYVASFGPACWISSRTNAGMEMIPVVYSPLVSVWYRGGVPARALNWYCNLWSSKNWGFTIVMKTAGDAVLWDHRFTAVETVADTCVW